MLNFWEGIALDGSRSIFFSLTPYKRNLCLCHQIDEWAATRPRGVIWVCRCSSEEWHCSQHPAQLWPGAKRRGWTNDLQECQDPELHFCSLQTAASFLAFIILAGIYLNCSVGWMEERVQPTRARCSNCPCNLTISWIYCLPSALIELQVIFFKRDDCHSARAFVVFWRQNQIFGNFIEHRTHILVM